MLQGGAGDVAGDDRQQRPADARRPRRRRSPRSSGPAGISSPSAPSPSRRRASGSATTTRRGHARPSRPCGMARCRRPRRSRPRTARRSSPTCPRRWRGSKPFSPPTSTSSAPPTATRRPCATRASTSASRIAASTMRMCYFVANVSATRRDLRVQFAAGHRAPQRWDAESDVVAERAARTSTCSRSAAGVSPRSSCGSIRFESCFVVFGQAATAPAVRATDPRGRWTLTRDAGSAGGSGSRAGGRHVSVPHGGGRRAVDRGPIDADAARARRALDADARRARSAASRPAAIVDRSAGRRRLLRLGRV